jgi:hypothetical protein
MPTAIFNILFPYLCSIEEDYSVEQVVTCLLNIYTTSWKVICGGGALSLGKCMSKVISINTSKMPCIKPVSEQAMASKFLNVYSNAKLHCGLFYELLSLIGLNNSYYILDTKLF